MEEKERLTDQQIAELDRKLREDLIEWEMKDRGISREEARKSVEDMPI